MPDAEEHLDAANAGGLVGSPRKFRKLPVVIDAVRWSGSNWHEVLELEEQRPPRLYIAEHNDLYIETTEGRMKADIGDWVIRGVAGELYPCKPDIFKATYEPA